MRRKLSKVVTLVVVMLCLSLVLLSFSGCAKLKFASYYKEYSQYDQVTELLDQYITGVKAAYEASDKVDQTTFALDFDTENAGDLLQDMYKEYSMTEPDYEIHEALFEPFREVHSQVLMIKMINNMAQKSTSSVSVEVDTDSSKTLDRLAQLIDEAIYTYKNGPDQE